jgi:Zn-dependent protease/predicted transcriptional regulator
VSWTVILAIIVVTVATRIDDLAPGIDDTGRWVVGGVVGAGFLLSALAHELGHAIAARRAGLPGGPVIVYFFGGAASMDLETRTPRDEIVTALAGPAVSLLIGVVFVGVAAVGLLADTSPLLDIGRVAVLIGGLNLVLGGVNLLPAFPLDGGRVVRGIGWSRSGDPGAGLRLAARTGRWLGIVMAGLGIVLILAIDSIDGLMLALSGWFVVSSARAVERNAEVDSLLEGVQVADVMDADVSGVAPGLTLDTFADQFLAAGGRGSLPVTRGDTFVGMLGVSQVRRVRRAKWAATRVEDLMVGPDDIPDVAPDTTLRIALDRLRRSGLDGLPVRVDGVMTGIVTRHAVGAAIRDRLRASDATGRTRR